MEFIRRIFALESDEIEFRVFKFGLLLFALETIIAITIALFHIGLFKNIITILAAGLIGGRIAAISTGLEVGFRPIILIVLLYVFNSIWLFVFYPLITIFYEHVIKVKCFGSMLNSTREIAESHKNRIGKYGIMGLFVFVWLPFPWTGSLVGSVIGHLIGMSTRRILFIVMPAMFLGIVIWTILFESVFILTEMIGKGIFFLIVMIILVISVFTRLYSSSKKQIEHK